MKTVESDTLADGARLGMSDEQLAEARRLGRLELYCDLADKAIDVCYYALVAAFVARPLWSAIGAWIPWELARLTLLFALLYLAHALLSAPLSYYSGHFLQKQFKLSTQGAMAWWRRHAHALLLGGIALWCMFVGLYGLIWLFGPWWWLVAAGAFFLTTVVFGRLAPRVLLPLFYKIEPIGDRDLSARMVKLAHGTGLAIDGLYRIHLSVETVKVNAVLAGLGRTRRVLLGDTLLNSFTLDEIEVTLAHEIGHHVFQHIPKTLVVGLISSALAFYACDLALRLYLGPFRYDTLPTYTLPLLLLTLRIYLLLMEPVQNFISRGFERQCDRYALERTGLREAYRSAYRKLAVLNKDDPTPNPITVFLFHSHPAITDRIALADRV